MTWMDIGRLALTLAAVALNIGMAVRGYRLTQQQLRRVDELRAAHTAARNQLGSVLAFVVALRDTPTVPVELRRAAARVIPPNVTVTITHATDKVH